MYQESIGNFDIFYNIKAMASVQIIVETFAGSGVVVKVATCYVRFGCASF